MITIAKNKNPSKKPFKKTLTQMKEQTELFRSSYLNAKSNERALWNAENRKMKFHSNYYKQAFINNYEDYYKNGGQEINKYNDFIYEKITGNAALSPDRSKRKKSGKRK